MLQHPSWPQNLIFCWPLSRSPQFPLQPQHFSTTSQNPIQPYSLRQANIHHSLRLLPLIYTIPRDIFPSQTLLSSVSLPYPPSAALRSKPVTHIFISITNIMGLRAAADSPPDMPSAMPSGASLAPAQPNGVNGTLTPNNLSADDNIRRFEAPSRTLSPSSARALFHSKTRCFV